MDGGLNQIGTALIAVFAVTFLALVVQIIYVLCRWQAASSKECVYFFWWRNQSRVEPKEMGCGVDDDSAAGEDEVEKWRELCGPSRALFTINEEEEREEIMDQCFESDDPNLLQDQDDDTTPFQTPSASPPYYTPSPSPPRPALDFPPDNENPTTAFFAIEISTH